MTLLPAACWTSANHHSTFELTRAAGGLANRLIHFGNDVKTLGSHPLSGPAFCVLQKWKEQARSAEPNLAPIQHAVISAEGERFYQHHGFDWHAIQIAATYRG